MEAAGPSSVSSTVNTKKDKTPFKRNYLACLNCRTRKVKCDLGSVDNPHDPPCARCKRERKECVFVESRRGMNNKQKTNKLINPPNNNFSSNSDSSTSLVTSLVSEENYTNPISNNRYKLVNKTETFNINPILPLPSPFYHSNIQNNNHRNLTTSDERSKGAVNSASNTLLLNSGTLPTAFTGDRLPKHDHLLNEENKNRNSDDIHSHLQTRPSDTPSRSSSNSHIETLPSVNSSIQSLTNNATMIYLSQVAGNGHMMLPQSKTDRIKNSERLNQLEKSVPVPRSLSNNTVNSLNTTPNSLATKSPTLLRDTEPISDSFGHDNLLYPIVDQDRLMVPPLTTSQSMRQRPSSSLADIEYILPSNESSTSPHHNQKILTELEARRLIKLFFATMHPFYPYIPQDLRDPDVLVGYPMLLCALLSISARYHPLPNKIGEWDNLADDDTAIRIKERGEKDVNVTYNVSDRHLNVHEQLWIYCQRLMSMTVWGESSSRSVGTLLAFLMFTEWNPRAIHFRWGDYANSSQDDSLASKKFTKNKNVGRGPEDSDTNGSIGSKRRKKNKNSDYTESSIYDDDNDEKFASLSAMKRSEIMSFMLIGTATRLSFLLDSDPSIFIATHVSEIHIAVGLNKKSMLQQTLSEVDVNDPIMEFSSYQKANIELLQFFSLCYETLYGTRPKFISLDKYQTLAILDILSPILENWYKKYYKLLKPSNIHCSSLSNCNDEGLPDWLYMISTNNKLERDLTTGIERESLILDYYYTKLYLYSLALSGDSSINNNLKNSKKGRNLRLDELARYSRYVELAYKAAKEVLAVIQRVRKLRLIKYMPVRWVTRVIKSVSFIVKCYLTLTTDIHTNLNSAKNEDSSGNTDDEILKLSVIPLEEIITLLQKTAICLRYGAPDELHLCTRYSTILMYLCSQFKTQMRERNEKKKMGIREYEKDVEFNTDDNNNEASLQNGQDHQQSKDAAITTDKREHHEIYSLPIVPNQEQFDNGYGYNNIQNHNNLFQKFSNQDGNSNQQHQQQQQQQQQQTSSYNLSPSFNDINFSSANQELFDDFFNKNPSEKLFNFFESNDNNNPGLDFVDQFTKEIEMDFLSKGGKH